MTIVRLSHLPSTRQIGASGNDAIVYDDQQVAIAATIFPGGSDPVWRTYNLGIGGGVAYSVLGFAVGEYLDFWVQTSHSMRLSTALDFHIHFTVPSDSASDRFKFQLDVAAASIGGTFAAPSGTPYSAEHILAGTEASQQNMLEIADIPAVNTTVSTLYACRLTRIAASASEYAPEVYLIAADCHYQRDTVGSLQEDSK